MEKIIRIDNLIFEYTQGEEETPIKAINKISLEIEKGSFTAIIGKNGSGKSTLAKKDVYKRQFEHLIIIDLVASRLLPRDLDSLLSESGLSRNLSLLNAFDDICIFEGTSQHLRIDGIGEIAIVVQLVGFVGHGVGK